MNDDRSSLPDNLRLKFPELRPVKRAPALVRVNGIGTGMYGRRDADPETGTYVKTHCLCIVFIPVFAFGAYRVADADRGWYFIGKEKLSPLAKSCNWAVLACVILLACGIAQHVYTSSPDYRARQQLKQAADLMESRKPLEAARIYADVANGPAHTDAGRRGFDESIEQCWNSDSPGTVEAALRLSAGLKREHNLQPASLSDPLQRGTALVEKFRGKDPAGALGIVRALALFVPTNTVLRPTEIDLLKTILASNPGHTNRAVELALLLEQDQNLEESCKVLLPLKDRLGSTEGARILGQQMLKDGNYNEAYGLLFPYVQTRLQELRGIEQRYTNAISAAYRRAIDGLNRNEADRSFYTAYEAASKTEREAMVEAYLEKRTQSDPALKRALAELASANRIVHVTLDLGIVQLNRAQTLQDPAARKTELEAAEKTFLAIHGLAGNSDEYRLFLGQVYYWLGRSREGKQLFDQLLASNNRQFRVVLALANTLREVGEEVQARELSEEAYRTATRKEDKFEAAALRARLQKDVDDQIAWLEKSDPDEVVIQIELNSARGEKALRDGNRDLAAQNFRKAIAGYEKIPKNSPATLNNFGLVCLNLYEVTGDMADHTRALSLLEQAVALDPGNSLLLMNTARQLFTRAYMDVVGDAIRYGAIKESPDSGMLAFLYHDEDGRSEVFHRLQEDEYLKKALRYLDKALLLAPKNGGLYWIAARTQRVFRDLPEMQKLDQRLRTASPDLTETKQNSMDFYAGAKDKEYLGRTEREIKRLESLLESSTIKEHPLSLEFVRIGLNGARQGLASYGGPAVDGRKVVDEARSVYRQHADAASLNALITALFYAANEELHRENSAYLQLNNRSRRALPPRLLIALLLDRGDALSETIRRNSNVVEARQLLKESGKLFPHSRNVDEWAIFRLVDPEESSLIARQLEENPASRLADEIEFRLNPVSSASILEQYWLRKMSGDAAGASRIYQEALKNGVPLPPL